MNDPAELQPMTFPAQADRTAREDIAQEITDENGQLVTGEQLERVCRAWDVYAAWKEISDPVVRSRRMSWWSSSLTSTGFTRTWQGSQPIGRRAVMRAGIASAKAAALPTPSS